MKYLIMDYMNFKFVSYRFVDNKILVQDMVGKLGELFKDTSDRLANNKEIVLFAVSNHISS